MEKRTRAPHGIHSRKISVSVSEADLKVLAARAKRVHHGNLSAVVHEMVETLRREEALGDLLGLLGGDRVSETEVLALRREIAEAKAGPKKRARRRAA